MGGYKNVGNRVILAGDSAGFAEPFLGEGIYFAILSVQLAAKTVVDASRNGILESLQRYERECRKKFGRDFEVAYRLAYFSYLEQYDMERITEFFFSEKLVQECMTGLMDGTIRYRDARTKLVWPYCKYLLAKAGLPVYGHDKVGN